MVRGLVFKENMVLRLWGSGEVPPKFGVKRVDKVQITIVKRLRSSHLER